MIQRMSDQHKIGFLDGDKSLDVKKSANIEPKTTIQPTDQKSKKLNNKDDGSGIMNVHSIFSARTGIIKDEGGPSKYIKSESSNTLWDTDKTSKICIDNKTKTMQEKEAVSTNRRIAEEKRMNEMVESLKSIDQTKASAVSPAGVFSGSNYKAPTGSMSMFDTKDFERLPDKTAGEKVKEDNASKKNQKDDSWRGSGKSITAKEAVSEYFDSLLSNKDK